MRLSCYSTLFVQVSEWSVTQFVADKPSAIICIVSCAGQHSCDGEDILDSWSQVQQEGSWRSSENGTRIGRPSAHSLRPFTRCYHKLYCLLCERSQVRIVCRQKSVFSRKSLRYAALGTGCTLTAMPRSTQPFFHPPRDGIWVSTLWFSNNTYGDGRMFGL